MRGLPSAPDAHRYAREAAVNAILRVCIATAPRRAVVAAQNPCLPMLIGDSQAQGVGDLPVTLRHRCIMRFGWTAAVPVGHVRVS